MLAERICFASPLVLLGHISNVYKSTHEHVRRCLRCSPGTTRGWPAICLLAAKAFHQNVLFLWNGRIHQLEILFICFDPMLLVERDISILLMLRMSETNDVKWKRKPVLHFGECLVIQLLHFEWRERSFDFLIILFYLLTERRLMEELFSPLITLPFNTTRYDHQRLSRNWQMKCL